MIAEVHHQKVTAGHLKRDAFLYVRQSTLRQVFENTESTKRQYALRERAVALGWPQERIVVIDSDLGKSGASIQGREGFQQLVTAVGMGRAGIVLGLEVSRLARNSSDWHRLLEICALTETLILDEDGVYEPKDFNDRLLLGLKGTMSEAEIHVLRARLRGGILSKARRGELRSPLPVGFAYDEMGRVRRHPDAQAQAAIRQVFQTFSRTGSAYATVKSFRQQKLLFPRRVQTGPRGRLVWAPLTHALVLNLLHNPRYAGAFFFGRYRTRRLIDGRTVSERLPQDQWHTLLRDAHDGYITWDEYEANQRQLRECAQAHGAERRKSPPREGPALLQGLVMCGVCGDRMIARYHLRGTSQIPSYVCQRRGIERAEPFCQVVHGERVDEAVGGLLVEMMTPVALEIALTVQRELQERVADADRLRRQQGDRARYEAELARQRFMQVDPNNRLVADVLEADWNEKLRVVRAAQDEYERQRQADHAVLDDEQRRRLTALATDFPRLWRDPKTPDRERKRMVRLLLEDVTLVKTTEVTAHIRFKGGTERTLTLPLPTPHWQTWVTPPAVVAEIDHLLEEHTEGEIARVLNERGLQSGKRHAFTRQMVQRIRMDYRLTSRYHRLRARGLLTPRELARKLRVCVLTIGTWRGHGLLRAHAHSDKDEYLYEPPGEDAPVKWKHKLSSRR